MNGGTRTVEILPQWTKLAYLVYLKIFFSTTKDSVGKNLYCLKIFIEIPKFQVKTFYVAISTYMLTLCIAFNYQQLVLLLGKEIKIKPKASRISVTILGDF